jgi:hypothetical protein
MYIVAWSHGDVYICKNFGVDELALVTITAEEIDALEVSAVSRDDSAIDLRLV